MPRPAVNRDRDSWQLGVELEDSRNVKNAKMNDAMQKIAGQAAGAGWRLSDEDEPLGGDPSDGLATAESKPKLARPPMYKVLIMNDDYTPMEFVVHVLETFFAMNREKATQLMLAVHTQGNAVAGIFPRDLAETKSEQVNQYAQENDHPLMSTVEMTD